MKNPSIVFTSPCVAELIDKDIKELKEDDVLVELMCSTISAGTERANLVGDANVNPSSSKPSIEFPRQSGYSSSGIVRKVGSAVTSVKEGDRVALSWSKHSKYCVMNERKVYKLDDAVDFDEAALVHIATFPLGAIRKCGLEVGESAIVMGLGVLGLLAVELLRAAGAAPIIAVDPVESKRVQALELGADYSLDPFSEGFAEKVKELTDGGVAVAIEVTGKGQGLDMVLDCMKKFGRVALLGCTRDSNFTIDYYRKVHWMGVSLIGAHTMARPKYESFDSYWTDADDARAILKLLKGKRLDFKCLIEETHSPAEAPEVYTRLANSPAFPIVQFDWSNL